MRIYGTNQDNPSHPVWCPEKTPIDMTLFLPIFYLPEFGGIGMSVSFLHPTIPVAFASLALGGPIDFLCEDQD
jgi:hypothetical protein